MQQDTDDRTGEGAIIQPFPFGRISSVNLLTDDSIVKSLKKSPYGNDQSHAENRDREAGRKHILRDQNTERLIPLKLA